MFRTEPATRGPRSHRPGSVSRTARRIAVDGALGGLALSLTGFTLADLVNPRWSPAETMISHYVHAPRGGWLIPLGTLVMAVASAALLWVAAACTRRGRTGAVLLGVWTAGLLVAAGFPTDPPGRWDQPPSIAGMLHGVAALLAFAALPAAAVLLGRVWRRDPRWRPVAGGLAVTTALTVAAFVLFLVTFVDVQGGPSLSVGPWATVTGLAERVMVWAYAGWLAVVAGGLRRIARDG